MSDGPDIGTLLEERPEFESALESVLDVDEDLETWTFDDVPIDSGSFGELVSRGVVEKVDGDYRLADQGAVRAALDGERQPIDSPVEPETVRSPSEFIDVSADSRLLAALIGALAVVVAFRLVPIGSVLRPGNVVLSGNDPYFYLYWTEWMVEQSDGALDLSMLSQNPTARGEPLLVATLWAVTVVAGGIDAAPAVLAAYPVVSGAITGIAVYLLAVFVTDDRRVGLAAVVLLSTLPTHAQRTGLGFADHHAFDYIWLSLTAVSLAVLVTVSRFEDLHRPRIRLATAGLAFGVAGQILAWEAGPLEVVPIGIVVVGLVVRDVFEDQSPFVRVAPIAAGVGIGALVVVAAHSVLGWHTTLVASTPAALFVGTVSVTGLGEVWLRLDRSAHELLAGYVVTGVAGALAAKLVFPTAWAVVTGRLTDFVFASSGIAETRSLLAANLLGLLIFLGTLFAFAIPVLVWGVRQAIGGERGWLVVVAYGWYFFVLSVIQNRFSGELAPFVAVAGASAFVFLLAKVLDSTPPGALAADSPELDLSIPDVRTVMVVVVLFLIVGGFGAVQVPVVNQDITITDDQYRAATWMNGYADDRGWTAYESSYVFSRWGNNRMYNYFVNGNSRSYSFALDNYGSFATMSNPRKWYRRLKDRVGFVVLAPKGRISTVYAHLYKSYGSATEDGPGFSHYRAVYVSPGGSVKVFTLVPGARIRGTTDASDSLSLTTSVDIRGASFEYTRQVAINATGHYSVVVPYPGEYTVGNRTVSVSESAVTSGTTLRPG